MRTPNSPFIAFLTTLSTVQGFAGIAADISIVGVRSGETESLPQQYVKSLRRWNVEISEDQKENVSAKLIPGTDSYDNSDGFVDPTSTNELWWPEDILILQARPTLDVLIQNGNPTHVFGGVDIRVPKANGNHWSNFGLNSQPLAKQWMTFGGVIDPNFRVECFVSATSDEETEKEEWERLGKQAQSDTQQVKEAVQTIGVLLSTLEQSSPLASGFHILSCPLSETWHGLPKPPKQNTSLELPPGYELACVATGLSNAKEVLKLDEKSVSTPETSILRVKVSSVAPGSKSEYLPDAYKPLYLATNIIDNRNEL